jgi:hypothetical protein
MTNMDQCGVSYAGLENAQKTVAWGVALFYRQRSLGP